MIRGKHENDDWEPIRALVRDIRENTVVVGRETTDAIRAQVGDYADFPYEEHCTAVQRQQAFRLEVLASRRASDAASLDSASRLAARRARQGVPVGAVLSAYQIGDLAFWRALMRRASTDALPLLPEAAEIMLQASSEAAAVLAREHTRASRLLEGGRVTLAHELLKVLPDPGEEPGAARLAVRLGLDPDGWFTAVGWRPDVVDDERALDEVSAVSQRAGGIVMVLVDGIYWTLVQSAEPVAVRQDLARHLTGGSFGVGAAREGIAGARTSLEDAALAMRATTDSQPVMQFGTDWVEALILGEAPRLAALLDVPLGAARAHSHLARTVLAFADCDMSLTRTAAAVHLHANSVTYRLDRWRDLSGLDPRTFRGLVQSVVACRIAD